MKKLCQLLFIVVAITFQNVEAQNNSANLSGVWRFQIDRNDVGFQQKWFTKNLDDTIKLPASMVERLKGDPITLKTTFTGSIYDSSWYFNPKKEKYRKPENLKMPFWLTQLNRYEGLAWYQRDIEIPAEWKQREIKLFLEHPHFITKVWLNDREFGEFNSLSVPHIYNFGQIAPGKYKLTIRIDNRLKSMDVGANSHSVTDHTQGNWNGIVGKMELQSFAKTYIEDVQVFPDIKNKIARIKINLQNESDKKFSGKIEFSASAFNTLTNHSTGKVAMKVELNKGAKSFEMTLPMGDNVQLWDEFNPALYQLNAVLTGKGLCEQKSVQFGMREISIQGKYFYINGRKTVLRGTVENAVFPLTGYPPRDVASWERVFRICKSYGLNHMRFHSFCPPEAAFIAADKLGFYLQPEGPSWPNHSTQLGRGLPIDTYLMDETKRIVKNYGNYASFTFLACGNEPRGNWVAWVTKFVNYWKATDSRRLYTGASVGGSWAWQPANQFHVKAGARSLTWKDARPESESDYKDKIDTVSQPYVSHETGQWCAFPNFEEIKKYTGVTRAKNFELYQEDLADNDMADQAHDFLMASGNLQALCYKHEIEKTLRTPDYAGFQLLCLNDYSGQGTALVGVLDAFWDEKGYITSKEFNQFCNSTVPLARLEKFVFRNNESVKLKVQTAHYGPFVIKNATIEWKLIHADGNVFAKGNFAQKDIIIGNDNFTESVIVDLTAIKTDAKLKLVISIGNSAYENSWDIWVYNSAPKLVDAGSVYVTDKIDAKLKEIIKNGGKALIMANGKVEYGKDVVQYYQPVFWNTSWFKMRPPHTTGVLVKNTHPVFNNFVTDNWANLNWWELINKVKPMLLTDFPKGFRPIVQPIDTWFVNRKLGMLFEAKVGNAQIMMTSMDLTANLQNRPVAESLYASVIEYMKSAAFNPEQTVSLQNIEDIFTKTAEPINSYSTSSPDELKKGVR